jgi:hypothetical protein
MNKDQQHVDPENYRVSDALIFFVVGIAIYKPCGRRMRFETVEYLL